MARRTKEEAEHTRHQIIDAAQRVFHERGVSRTTLEKVAQAAGVTRGAVYWHFANKAEFSRHAGADVPKPVQRTDRLLLSEAMADPLDAIETAMQEFFQVLEERQDMRQVFEIIFLRCEYVDEFSQVQDELRKPAYDFLDKVGMVYRRAAAQGTLRPGLDPEVAARDTWIFMGGLIHQIIESPSCTAWRERTAEIIASHIALRRAPR